MDFFKKTRKNNVKMLIHNVVIHPIVGLIWFLGYDRLGKIIHGIWSDE